MRILAVDPQDSDVVYLRVIGAAGDAVAVARNGGGTVAVPVTFARGQLSAFARLSSGTVLVGALIATDAGGTDGTAVRSTDGGASFQPWTTLPAPTHLVGLAERVENGRARLYLSGKNYSDGWALAVSDDEGQTLTKLLTYDQVKGVKACVRQICQDTCNFENMQGIWDLSVCAAHRERQRRRRLRRRRLGLGLRVRDRPDLRSRDALCRRSGGRASVPVGARAAPVVGRDRILDGDRLDSPRGAV